MKKYINNSIKVIFSALILVFCLAACGQQAQRAETDRQGNAIVLPEKIDRIMTFGPSNTEIVAGLGLADKIIAADSYSSDVEGISEDIPLFDMLNPDAEQILILKPDLMFVTGMAQAEGTDPYKPFKDAGICVIYIPSSSSIEGIMDDVKYIAGVLNVKSQGEAIVKLMEEEINAIRKIGSAMTDKKTVLFEVSCAPYIYSFGEGVFLNEMIEIIGAENILADQNGWLSVTEETILGANPDVILTSVNYIDDPVGEILGRPGWEGVTAVKNSDVYYIDTNSSNRASQFIIKALKEMAKAVYPDKF